MNVSEPTINAIKECNTACFALNRFMDTLVDSLGIDFVCNTASKMLHEGVAHAWPALADVLNERCLGAFNIKTYYGATPAGDWTWDSLIDMMNEYMDETIKIQTLFMGAIKVATENGDYHIAAELYDIIRDVNKQVEQAILVRDKAELYGDNLTSFDRHFPSFYILDEAQED